MFVSLLMLGACVQGVALYGQEEKAPMYLEQKGEGEALQAEPIYTGLVIAYGVRIPPPYYVTLRNDSVFINDVLLEPRKREPGSDTISTVVHEWAIPEYQLESEIGNRFKWYFRRDGFEKTRQRIFREYSDNPLLDSLVFKDQVFLVLYYKSGHPIHMDLAGRMLPPTPPVSRDSLVHDNLVRLVKGTQSDLRRNCVLLYSYKGGEGYLWKEEAEEFKKIVHDAKNGRISLEEARVKLNAMILDKSMVPQILEHLDSWD
jgi:hypothetical protein